MTMKKRKIPAIMANDEWVADLKTAKPTPGPWRVAPADDYPNDSNFNIDAGISGTDGYIADCGDRDSPHAFENAMLIAEAGTVYHETGLTPRQLAEQRKELLRAIRYLRFNGPPGLGNTDPTTGDTFDAGICALIAKIEGR